MIQTHKLICGINSATEKLEKGENENCRAYSVEGHKSALRILLSVIFGLRQPCTG